jgi:hypothetical protein
MKLRDGLNGLIGLRWFRGRRVAALDDNSRTQKESLATADQYAHVQEAPEARQKFEQHQLRLVNIIQYRDAIAGWRATDMVVRTHMGARRVV